MGLFSSSLTPPLTEPFEAGQHFEAKLPPASNGRFRSPLALLMRNISPRCPVTPLVYSWAPHSPFYSIQASNSINNCTASPRSQSAGGCTLRATTCRRPSPASGTPSRWSSRRKRSLCARGPCFTSASRPMTDGIAAAPRATATSHSRATAQVRAAGMRPGLLVALSSTALPSQDQKKSLMSVNTKVLSGAYAALDVLFSRECTLSPPSQSERKDPLLPFGSLIKP